MKSLAIFVVSALLTHSPVEATPQQYPSREHAARRDDTRTPHQTFRRNKAKDLSAVSVSATVASGDAQSSRFGDSLGKVENALLRLAEQGPARGSPDSLDAIEQTLLKLASESKARMSPECEKTLNNIGQLIQGSVLPSINASLDAERDRISGFSDAFVACDTAKATSESKIAGMKANQTTMHEEYITCISEEAALKIEHDGCAAETNENVKLEDCESQKAIKADAVRTLQDCDIKEFQTLRDYLLGRKDFFETQYKSYKEIKGKCTNATAARTLAVQECNLKKTQHETKRKECLTKQEALEMKTCELAEASVKICPAHSTCFSGEETKYCSARSTIRTEELKLHRSLRALNRITCVMASLLLTGVEKTSAVKACQDDNGIHDEYVLKYMKVGEPGPCVAPASVSTPCSPAFKEEYYANVTEATPQSECIPCPGIDKVV